MTTPVLVPLQLAARHRRRPERLLTQNSELRDEGVWNWTIPALATRLPDGRVIKTCPAAGVCAQACYARNGTYNFRGVFSYGGNEDHLILPTDRVADVFPDEAAILGAGYHSQDASDLLAVLGPAPVGIPANNIPQFRRRMAGRTFREWQAERDARRAARPR